MFVPHVYLPSGSSEVVGRWIVIDPKQNVLLVDGDFPVGVQPPLAVVGRHLLGLEEGEPVWAAAADGDASVGDAEGQWVNLRALYGAIPETDWVLAGRAAQVLVWDRDHQFCGRCGASTKSHPVDRARTCQACSLMAFPRISPAVIMLVERETDSGPEVLLAWGRKFPGRFFSALAGFVEPGESLEECVVREVFEETAIVVNNVAYHGSQPWPFPHSLMVGFNASYVSGEISVQEEEIVEAGWFSPGELPTVPRGGMSIAGWLLEDWLRRVA